MTNGDSKSLSLSYPMVGGHGSTSYAQNSKYQKAVIDVSKRLMHEGIMEKLDFKNDNFHVSNQFNIADYGCSIGPNTFFAIQNIIESIKLKHHHQLPNNKPLEFQVYFSDHIENDFNTLFKTLPANKDYFAAGVPGSFHEQLLPKSSLHFVHCSSSLHWLSMVPKQVTDKTSLAWNKENIICGGSNEEVKKAFLAQFDYDLNKFLNARAKEIVVDGVMVLIFLSLPEGVILSETGTGIWYESLGYAIMDLVETGIIAKEELYSFNLPIYYPTTKELDDIIKQNGYFNIETMEILENPIRRINPSPQVVHLGMRAVFEGIVREHFRDDNIVEKIFERYAKKLVDYHSIVEASPKRSVDHFIMLKRKSDC